MTAARGSTLAPRPFPPEADTLQTVYDRGNSISVDGNPGPIVFENVTDGVDVLQINRTFAGGGEGIQFSMGALTTGDAIDIDMVSGATGFALDIHQGANAYLRVGPTGALTATPASGQSIAMTVAGAGTIAIAGASTVSIGGGSAFSSLEFGTTGNIILRAASGRTLSLGSNNASTHLVFNSAGAITLTPSSTRDVSVSLNGAGSEFEVTSALVSGGFVVDRNCDERRVAVAAAAALFADGGVTVGSGNGCRTVQTTNATVTTIVTITTQSDKCYTVVVDVSGLQSGGSNGVGYVRAATVRNDSGTLTQVGTTTAMHTAEDAALAACDVTVAISGTNILVQVTGIAATTIDWKAFVRVTEN